MNDVDNMEEEIQDNIEIEEYLAEEEDKNIPDKEEGLELAAEINIVSKDKYYIKETYYEEENHAITEEHTVAIEGEEVIAQIDDIIEE